MDARPGTDGLCVAEPVDQVGWDEQRITNATVLRAGTGLVQNSRQSVVGDNEKLGHEQLALTGSCAVELIDVHPGHAESRRLILRRFV